MATQKSVIFFLVSAAFHSALALSFLLPNASQAWSEPVCISYVIYPQSQTAPTAPRPSHASVKKQVLKKSSTPKKEIPKRQSQAADPDFSQKPVATLEKSVKETPAIKNS